MKGQRRDPVDSSHEPIDLFRSIKSKLSQRAGSEPAEGITVDLLPIGVETLTDAVAADEMDGAQREPAPLGAGDLLGGRYEIEGRLGSGGMATVYQALDRARIGHDEASAHVAVKVLHQQTRTRAEALSRLRREFYCTQSLSHPSIVKVYELDLDPDFPFFTMELIEGEILPKVAQAFYPLPVPQAYAWAVIREVGAGLVHAHDRRVMHGDVKPQNVMVTNSGEVRILDFGRSGGSAVALTPAYASCELLEGRELDARDDLFALACLSYELLAAEHPFQHRRSTDARAADIVPRRPPGLSRRQWNALRAGLAWNRDDRPRSVRDWLAALDIGTDPLGPLPLRPDEPALPFLRSKTSRVWMALTAVALACGIAWAMLSRPTLPAAVIEAADSTPAASAPLNVERALADAAADAPEPAVAQAPLSKNLKRTGASAARPVDKTERISLASSIYTISRGEKFAEVRVQRSTGSKGDTSFEWWTEPGSALAGEDYVTQTPTAIFFPAGKRAVTIFIKVLPNAARKRAASFYVVLGNPSEGAALGSSAKAAVTLHP